LKYIYCKTALTGAVVTVLKGKKEKKKKKKKKDNHPGRHLPNVFSEQYLYSC